VASNNVHPQGVPRFARLNAVGALVEESLNVRLYVLLHRGPDLAGEVALGALPAGLARHSVVAGDHQLVHLPVQLEVHRRLCAAHLASFPSLPWLLHRTAALLIRRLPHLNGIREVATLTATTVATTTSHPRRRLDKGLAWLRVVLLVHVSSQRVPRLQDLRTESALVDNGGDVGLNVLLHRVL